jgi:hypothetical protein
VNVIYIDGQQLTHTQAEAVRKAIVRLQREFLNLRALGRIEVAGQIEALTEQIEALTAVEAMLFRPSQAGR